MFRRLPQLALPIITTFSLLLVCFADETQKPEEIVAKHLEAIGTPEARAKVKSRAVEGVVHFSILSRTLSHGGTWDGTLTLLTEGRKLVYYVKFASNYYYGEWFIFDGDRLEVRAGTANNRRSSFGEFVRTQDAVIREGLMGGVLSTSWPLLNLQERKVKLSYKGSKTLDGERLLDLRYQPKGNSDLDIHLYFDPGTFRHVQTVCSLTVHPSFVAGKRGASEALNATQSETRYQLEERFGDFKTEDGLTLPRHYIIQYSQEGSGLGSVSQWDTTAKNIKHNVSPDPRNFQVK